MSFLHDTVLPGSAGVYLGGTNGAKERQQTLRKSQSHGGLFTPLVQLVRNPFRVIGDAVGSFNELKESSRSFRLDIDGRRQLLYIRIKIAESFEEWKTAATELDILEGNDAWKLDDESPEYDHPLIAARLKQLDDARLSCDVNKMVFLIRTSLTRGLGGMGDLRLYKHSHIGTKALIERYIDSAEKTLTALLEVSAKQTDSGGGQSRKLLESLLAARQSFGRSALLLSGGATFGMNHVGVVKALWQARLLPRIISGASAGSIVCAVLCTKTDAEMPQVLQEFCYGDLAVFEKEEEEDGLMKKAVRFLKYGSLFDISHLMNVMRNLLGDITFQEAYNRTRRILNITVSSAGLFELPRLLNYVTAPNVMIWSAVCASCSVPFVFSPASLLAKDPRTGREVPWDPTPSAGWIDGSVDNDLPMTRLAEMFNVNHFIVSQVNPHVVPFLVKEEENISAEARGSDSDTTGSPSWVDNLAHLAKGEALHRLHVLAEMGVFPNYLTKARSILSQRYSGDITIFPAISYAHLPRLLSNPTSEFMLQCMLTGEHATWPKLSRIQNHLAIEIALDEAIQLLRARVVFSTGQADVRLNTFNRPVSQGNEPSQSGVNRPIRKMTRFAPESAPSTTHTIGFTPHRENHPHFHLPPGPHVTKPYLPSHPMMKHSRNLRSSRPKTPTSIALSSSSGGPGAILPEIDYFSGNESVPLSNSQPASCPANRFQSASQPTTPSVVSHVFGHPHTPFQPNLALGPEMMTKPAQPGSPELRYKRQFHPLTGAARTELEPVHSLMQHEVETMIQPPASRPLELSHSESLPESEIPGPGNAEEPVSTSSNISKTLFSRN